MAHPIFAVCQALIADTLWPARFRQSIDTPESGGRFSGEPPPAAARALDVLRELSARRDRFLSTGDLVEICPVLAFNMVVEDIDYMLRLPSAKASMLLDVVVAFNDALETNLRAFESGGVDRAEPHWCRYFRTAISLSRRKHISQTDVLRLILYGTAAHLNDLPRALEHVCTLHGRSLTSIRDEYEAIDELVRRSVGRSVDDVRIALRYSETRYLKHLMTLGARYVVYERRRAWDAAVKGSVDRNRAPQPVLEREGSRTQLFETWKLTQEFRNAASVIHS